ncbi:MAG: sulfite exporter TauE/SafE family protein [Clostridium sp.]|nr:sulfite exporter TauE/SafE family protein [Clostridium sp.]
MGGGVIIKPVLDATETVSVASANFLSCCTVLGMCLYSVIKTLWEGSREIRIDTSTPLALGAVVGGMAGKQLFQLVSTACALPETAGKIQAGLLLALTAATFVFTLHKEHLRCRNTDSAGKCLFLGVFLGGLGAFLGIGGGPFNMAALFYFFSMKAGEAARNSLYIILFSQASSLVRTLVSGSVPEVPFILIAAMVLCGLAGSEAGGRIGKRLDERASVCFFEGAMLLVMGICIYNMAF